MNVALKMLALAVLVAADGPGLESDTQVETALDCQPSPGPKARPVVGKVLKARSDPWVLVRICKVAEWHWDLECSSDGDHDIRGFINTTYPLSGRDGCAQMHASLQYTTKENKILKLRINGTDTHTANSPACQPGQHVVQRDTLVTLQEVWAPMPKRASGPIPIRTWGTECDFDKGYCASKDPSQGDAFWDVDSTRYDVLFEGPGKLVETYNAEFYVSGSQSEPWAYRLVYGTRLRDHEAYVTDEPRVIVVIDDGNSTLGTIAQPGAQDGDEAQRAASTFKLVERELAADERRRAAEHSGCLRDRMVLQIIKSLQTKQAELATQVAEANQALRTLSQKSG